MSTSISIRVPWHDSRWDGKVCRRPDENCHCIDYENILRQKDTGWELSVAGKNFNELRRLPPCSDESGGFLSSLPWRLAHRHPYSEIKKLAETHGHLQETAWTVEPYTAQAVPFHWLRRSEVDEWAQPKIATALPGDEEPPRGVGNWVFSPVLQEAVLEGFWAPVTKDASLAFFYTKGAHPVADDVPRLVVGIGEITGLGPIRHYNSSNPSRRQHPIWQRDVAHSLRTGGIGGLLVPFHEYLGPTGDPDVDSARAEMARQLVIAPEPDQMMEFSYRTEWVSADAAISVLDQALVVVGRIREDRIAAGSWEAAESWLNERLGRAWRLRGPHPGLGPVLEAMGLRLGTSLVHLLAGAEDRFAANPWTAVAPVLSGEAPPPAPRFKKDLDAFRPVWNHVCTDGGLMALAKSLSLFALDAQQAKRWWDRDKRRDAAGTVVTDAALVDNPYLLAELDRGDATSRPVSFPAVDRGFLAGHATGTVSPSDRRRLRAGLVSVLRHAEQEGDTLLGLPEARRRALEIPAPESVEVPQGWLTAEAEFVAEQIRVIDGDPAALQLLRRVEIAGQLQRKLGARAMRTLKPLDEPWRDLLVDTVSATLDDPTSFDPTESRVAAALEEQTNALEVITTRKLTCLVGRAGTGKTTVLGALSRAQSLQGQVLFLAPTGKARVRLETRVARGTDVQTVAQFLYRNKRYDGRRQQPIVGEPCCDGHTTIVIDESSMLTEDDLAAVLATFTGRVERLILVGDPAQLPPIGPGRPFADLVAHLDPPTVQEDEDPDDVARRRGALARLTQEVRTVAGRRSDTLRLAAWYTGDELPPDAEGVFADLSARREFNDLDVRFWNDPGQLHTEMVAALDEYLDLKPGDTATFNASFELGALPTGFPIVEDPSGAERWQVLSPVRRDVWGCGDLNRWVQGTWRGDALRKARDGYIRPFGPQEIIRLDKVILLQNGDRDGWEFGGGGSVTEYLANGEIGMAARDNRVITSKGTGRKWPKGSVMDVAFSGRRGKAFGFFRGQFGGESNTGLFERKCSPTPAAVASRDHLRTAA